MTVVLITGALTGIGRATALAFAQEGDQIVVSGRHGDTGEDLVQELRALGAEAEFICADVRHDGEMRDLIDKTVKRFGRLDVAVNNAGTEGHPGPVTQQTPESYRFKALGWFLDDLVLTPVNALPKAQRMTKSQRLGASLAERIRGYQPLAIVSVMRGIGDIVNEAAVAAGSDAPRYVVPFPGNGQQRRFLDAMARIVPMLPKIG